MRGLGALVVIASLASCTCRKVREEVPASVDARQAAPPASTIATASAPPAPALEAAAKCGEATHRLTASDGTKARQLDLGKWTFEKDRIAVYSWSYTEPGLLVFGDAGENATIRATMQSAKPAAAGNQGIALCVRDEGDAAHRDELYFARYYEGSVELLTYASFGGYGKGGYGWNRVMATRPIDIEKGAPYALQLCVEDGRRVSVWLDGKIVLAYGSARALRGRPALVAANGSYEFRDVSWGVAP